MNLKCCSVCTEHITWSRASFAQSLGWNHIFTAALSMILNEKTVNAYTFESHLTETIKLTHVVKLHQYKMCCIVTGICILPGLIYITGITVNRTIYQYCVFLSTQIFSQIISLWSGNKLKRFPSWNYCKAPISGLNTASNVKVEMFRELNEQLK